MYGKLDNFEFPTSPDEWATDRWFRFAMRKDPELSWLSARAAPQDLRLRNCNECSLADHPGLAAAELGPRDAQEPGELALRFRRIR